MIPVTEYIQHMGFEGGASGEEPTCQCRNVKDTGSVPRWERSPGGGHGNPLQYSCLENPMDRGAWWGCSPQGDKQSDMTEATQHTHTHLSTVDQKYTRHHTGLMEIKSNKLQFLWETVCSSNIVLFYFVSLMHKRVLKCSNCSINICGGPLCSQKSLSLAKQYQTLCI